MLLKNNAHLISNHSSSRNYASLGIFHSVGSENGQVTGKQLSSLIKSSWNENQTCT